MARAICACIERPKRDVVIGGVGAWPGILGERLAPRLVDRLTERTLASAQREPGTLPTEEDGLWEPPAREGDVRGRARGPILRHSLTTAAGFHPARTAALLAAAGLGAGALARGVRRRAGRAV